MANETLNEKIARQVERMLRVARLQKQDIKATVRVESDGTVRGESQFTDRVPDDQPSAPKP